MSFSERARPSHPAYESPNDAIIRSGFRKEDLERHAERDPLREFLDDHTVLAHSIALLKAEVDDVCTALEETGEKEEIVKSIESMREGLISFERRLWNIVAQGELFRSMKDAKGREVSVKQAQLDELKSEFRDWYTMIGSAKNLLQKITHDFPTAKGFYRAIQAVIHEKGKREQVYGRGFSASVAEWEKSFAEVMDVRDVALCNSGMSAIEACLRASNLHSGDVIFVGQNFYTQTKLLLAELQQRGIIIVQIDTMATDNLLSSLERHKPKLVFFEGIENAPDMTTADIDAILRINAEWNWKEEEHPFRLVIDNTFASPALLHLGERIKKLPQRQWCRWAAIESATKYHQRGMDQVTAGVVYSDDRSFIAAVRKNRGMIGAHLQERLVSYLPKADAAYLEQKMLRHSMNALLLAQHLEKLGMRVHYPGLESHPAHAQSRDQYEKGFGGVFYIAWDNAHKDPQRYVDRVHREAEKLGVPVKIGVSFGHPETWLETMPPDIGKNWQQGDKRQWSIRVMPGEENIAQMRKVLEAFKRAYGAL